ncbi:MAG: YciI family protein [Longimicrobiales bacterium]|nr:YciI family protein [Longimicrobiales bacterium]
MRHLVLICESEATAPHDEGELQKWFEYTERLQASGCMLGGEALQSTSTATTVRGNGGTILTTDGPFAETKEQLGGFYMADCQDLDEALRWATDRWAAEIPGVHRGSRAPGGVRRGAVPLAPRRAIDVVRRARTLRRRAEALERLAATTAAAFEEPVALPGPR